MTTAVTLATWLIAFGGWFALSFFAAVLIGRIIRGPQELDTQGREQVGVSPVGDFTAEREARVARAQFRHLTRHGKDAA